MKYYLLFLLIFASKLFYGQSLIIGKWKVSCPSEKTSSSSVKFCSLCSISQNDVSSLEIKSFEITINESKIIIRKDSVNNTLPYVWNERTNTLEFKYQNKTYKFSLLISEPNNLRILKDNDGLLVLFEMKK